MWQNFGTAARIRVDGSPERHAFIGFDTASLAGTEVERHASQISHNEPRNLNDLRVLEAKLRLYSIDDGGGGTVYVYPNADQWEETELTWIGTNLGNGPDSKDELQLGSFGDLVAYEWQEIDVTEAFRGTIADFTTFVIKSESSDGVIYASRERASGTYSPEIVLTLSGAGTPTSSPGIPTYAPTAVSSDVDELSEAPTPKPSRQPTQKPTEIPTAELGTTTNAPTDVPSARPTKKPTSSPQRQSLEPSEVTKIGDIQGIPTMSPVQNHQTFPSAACQTCPPTGTLFVAGSNCSGFFRCVDGARDNYHECGEGTMFNNLLQVCDHPYNFTCTCNPV